MKQPICLQVFAGVLKHQIGECFILFNLSLYCEGLEPNFIIYSAAIAACEKGAHLLSPCHFEVDVGKYKPYMEHIGNWLVVWNIFIFPYLGNFIIPTDELIFFRGVAQPPTRYGNLRNTLWICEVLYWILGSHGVYIRSCLGGTTCDYTHVYPMHNLGKVQYGWYPLEWNIVECTSK